jgi:hypothetical protein
MDVLAYAFAEWRPPVVEPGRRRWCARKALPMRTAASRRAPTEKPLLKSPPPPHKDFVNTLCRNVRRLAARNGPQLEGIDALVLAALAERDLVDARLARLTHTVGRPQPVAARLRAK